MVVTGPRGEIQRVQCWRGRELSLEIQSAINLGFDGVKRAPFPKSGQRIVGFFC